jgi:uncharacterized protein (TIGR00255 family)
MSLKSMTGFARSSGTHAGNQWAWEVRSVNGRGLDIRTRLPPGYEALEPRIRETASKACSRGNVSITLNVRREASATELTLNEAALAQVMAIAERIGKSGKTGLYEKPRIDGLLAIRGVLEVVETEASEEAVTERDAVLTKGLTAAMNSLVSAREQEGLRLKPLFESQLDTIERLATAVEAAPARQPEAIRNRLREQVRRLMEASPPLDEARLYQEAALIATRADVEEELARLKAHVASARELIAAPTPAGRRLDFLAQELNREANTLCSKAGDVEVTRLGLDLKAVIDQLREQVQNIE